MLAIGRALMSSPRLLMLDEPSLGIAPLGVQRILSHPGQAGVPWHLSERSVPSA